MARGLRRQAAGGVAAILLAGVCLAACGDGARFNLTDVTGAKFGRDFALTDHEGRRHHALNGRVRKERRHPERDRALLGQYLPAFHPKFVGLYGDAAATARTAQEFKVYYDKRPAQAGGYSVDHTAGIYVFDREGRLRVFAPYGAQQAALVHDIRLLLKGA